MLIFFSLIVFILMAVGLVYHISRSIRPENLQAMAVKFKVGLQDHPHYCVDVQENYHVVCLGKNEQGHYMFYFLDLVEEKSGSKVHEFHMTFNGKVIAGSYGKLPPANWLDRLRCWQYLNRALYQEVVTHVI